MTRWAHRHPPRSFAPRNGEALHQAARGPPMDYRDNPQHRVLLHRVAGVYAATVVYFYSGEWRVFTPALTGGNITTRRGRIVHWATAHRLRKPSSRWTRNRSCTNIHGGPLNGGQSLSPYFFFCLRASSHAGSEKQNSQNQPYSFPPCHYHFDLKYFLLNLFLIKTLSDFSATARSTYLSRIL